MGHLLIASVLLSALMLIVHGQTCPSISDQCYFTGAGTISAGTAKINEYFAIGGLFDIHELEDGKYCGTKISQSGMMNLLAFYWSVNKYSNMIVNSNGKRMTVGSIAFDNCMRPDQTVENVLSFAQGKIQVQGVNQQNVVGYVGPYSNMDAARTGMLATDLKITLISPDAFSLDLNNNKQATLLRMRPSLEMDLKAIAGFLTAMKFKYVMVVYSTSSVYKMAYDKMVSMVGSSDELCNNIAISLDDNASMDTINNAAAQLMKYSTSKFVVPLLPKDMVKKLMQATNSDQNLIYFLNSDIGRDMNYITDHAIVVEPSLPGGNVLNDFNDFLTSVRTNATKYANLQRTDVINPWLNEYIAQNNVMPNLDSSPSPVIMSALRTIQSVEAFIDGLDNAILTECATNTNPPTNYQFCDDLRNIEGRENILYKYIKGNRFGSNGQLNVDNVMFNYYVFQNAKGTFTKIGTFKPNDNSVEINVDLSDSEFGQAFSGSVCSNSFESNCCLPLTTVAPSTTPIVMTLRPSTAKPSELVNVQYPKNKEITGAFSNIDRMDDEYGTRFDVNQKWIIALGVLAGLGVVCVLVFEIYILYKMIGTRMGNKWRTMWLGQLLLFGILLSYAVCFAYLFIPTKATCGITRFGVGVAYAICFAVLLVKLMVILTSKSSDVLLPGDGESPNYLKGVYQFLMFAFAVGVQIVINTQWLITVPPEAVPVVSNSGDRVWVCNHYTWLSDKSMFNMGDFVRTNFENHLLSLTYIMVLILIITILSLNAHGIITNHRESVFIGIAAGFSIPLWLAWGLVGGLNKDKDYGHEFGDACMAFGLFCTATLILFTMFLPKVRQLVNMGVEGIYLEDDRDTIYGGSVIMAPPSYKSKGPSSVIYVNNQGIYSEPVVVGNGDSKLATHLKHQGSTSTYSAPTYLKKTESTYGGSRVLRVTDDLKGRHPNNTLSKQRGKPVSEMAYNSTGRPRSLKGTLPRSRSQSDLGAL